MVSANIVASAWADKRGFLPEVPFVEVRSTALPVNGPKRSGYYLLRFKPDTELEDSTFYVGESVDLRSRMGGHNAKWGDEILSVRLLPVAASKQQLKKYERFLTRELERKGVAIRNILNASTAAGRDELEELLPRDEQERWYADPRRHHAADTTPLKELADQEVRYSTAARRYREAPEAASVTALLGTYLQSCVPAPRATEFQYWAVSTGTYSTSRYPRRFCVNVGKMETFVVHTDKRSPNAIHGFINVRRSVLMPTKHEERQFKQRHRDARVSASYYEDAGDDTVQLRASSLSSLQHLLTDPQVTRAAARLVLDVMRKHFCVYTRYHCPQLVQMVYPDYPRPTSEPLATDVEARTEQMRYPDRPTLSAVEDVADTVANPAAEDEVADVEQLGDQEIYWIVGCGRKDAGRNRVEDFLRDGEWRMDPDGRYEAKVADMLPGEKIAVRSRRNITADAPFDSRGHRVSVMDFHLRGIISGNPGDGCSVRVSWDTRQLTSKRYYLYTSQDTVWPVARGVSAWWDDLIGFIFDDHKQDVDFFRNLPFWARRFGDR